MTINDINESHGDHLSHADYDMDPTEESNSGDEDSDSIKKSSEDALFGLCQGHFCVACGWSYCAYNIRSKMVFVLRGCRTNTPEFCSRRWSYQG